MKYIKFYFRQNDFYDQFIKLRQTKNFRLIDIKNQYADQNTLVFSCEGDEKEITELNIHLHYQIFYKCIKMYTN